MAGATAEGLGMCGLAAENFQRDASSYGRNNPSSTLSVVIILPADVLFDQFDMGA